MLRSALELEQAQTEFDTYGRFTVPKTLRTLEAEVVKARKWFDHEAGDYVKSKDQLAHYRTLVERCTIRAPHDGFAMYANSSFREEAERTVIEQGASVRQGQALFCLPDLSRLEAVAMLHDTIVNHVRAGMAARVRVEGTRGVVLEGHVEALEDLPRRSLNDVTYYGCVIAFDAFPPRPPPRNVRGDRNPMRTLPRCPGGPQRGDERRSRPQCLLRCRIVGPGASRDHSRPVQLRPDRGEGGAEGRRVGRAEPAAGDRRFSWRTDPLGRHQPGMAALASHR
jgi:hypothetical protein